LFLKYKLVKHTLESTLFVVKNAYDVVRKQVFGVKNNVVANIVAKIIN